MREGKGREGKGRGREGGAVIIKPKQFITSEEVFYSYSNDHYRL
jgi:hypothetical protein